MKTLQQILGIGALVLGLNGCSEQTKKEPVMVDIFGKPLSVAYTAATHQTNSLLAVVINAETTYGKTIMLEGRDYSSMGVMEAAALIQSEINDGDDEDIFFHGYFNENNNDLNNYVITSVHANGIDVNLEE